MTGTAGPLEVTATLPHDRNLDRGLTAPPQRRVAPEVSGPAESQARYGCVESPTGLASPGKGEEGSRAHVADG